MFVHVCVRGWGGGVGGGGFEGQCVCMRIFICMCVYLPSDYSVQL